VDIKNFVRCSSPPRDKIEDLQRSRVDATRGERGVSVRSREGVLGDEHAGLATSGHRRQPAPNGGTIEVESVPNATTRVTVRLPRFASGAQAASID